MATNVWVKVVGFDGVERHSLNTIFRLSERSQVTYMLWSPESPSPPQVAFIDMDSYEASMEMASPNFNPNLKLICVGAEPPANAWRALQRPVDWAGVVHELDNLFNPPLAEVDIDIGIESTVSERIVPPGVKVSLLVGMSREERLYLRSRLALAGLTQVDEAASAGEATALIGHRHYELVVVDKQLNDADPWSLIQALQSMAVPVRTVILATRQTSWAVEQEAERAGCTGLLEIPFNPRQIFDLLQKV